MDKRIILLTILLLLIASCRNSNFVRCGDGNCGPLESKQGSCPKDCSEQTNQNIEVPAEFKDLYSQLEQDLDVFIGKFPEKSASSTSFGAMVLPANSNAGYSLLEEGNKETVILYLDALLSAGVDHVQLDIQFPIFYSGFHDDESEKQAFIDFYKFVADEIRKRGMTFSVESQVIFTNDAYSTLPVKEFYESIDFEEHKKGRAETLKTILVELEPDYLTIINEPKTEAMLTGQDLDDQDVLIEYVEFLLEEIIPYKGKTLIGAGLGTWEKDAEELAQAFSEIDDVDFINIHIYPINNGQLDNAENIPKIASDNNKGIVLGELGLYKIRDSEYLEFWGEEGSVTIYSRDAYSFFALLDQKFLLAVKKISDKYDIMYTSIFWSRILFGYVDHENGKDLQPRALMREQNKEAFKNIQSGMLSSTGEYYRDEINS